MSGWIYHVRLSSTEIGMVKPLIAAKAKELVELAKEQPDNADAILKIAGKYKDIHDKLDNESASRRKRGKRGRRSSE